MERDLTYICKYLGIYNKKKLVIGNWGCNQYFNNSYLYVSISKVSDMMTWCVDNSKYIVCRQLLDGFHVED
jgi:hypothetical protein